MVESYKLKSKLATAISFIAMFIAYMGKDGLAQIIPPQYAWLIPPLVGIAAYIVTQSTENIRVEVAEQLVREDYHNQQAIFDNDAPVLNEECVAGDDDGC